MLIPIQYARLLSQQAAAATHQDLLDALIDKVGYCDEYRIFVRIEILERIKS